tara:strand:- start:285 stop:713 length:429 start_codon:yes stop_codon:yes gene_type:complete
MASQLNVDTIKGKSTAGSVSIQGEGTATTNLQQGLAKAWTTIDADASTADALDSFNEDSIDDDGAGKYGINLTNNMVNVIYFQACSSCNHSTSSDHQRYTTGAYSGGTMDRDKTTSNAKIGYFGSTYADTFVVGTIITGDLA